MSYQVLARKWRPKNFSTVIGQAHVIRALQNALQLDRLHHAYLFVGTRGVGKTTLARIFAKCLNCEAGINSEPCCQCSACSQIDQGNFVDLLEVDAASRTGVDDMRELLETVQYAPNVGRFKIYLIDEVHMLSISSFNALLKTLEEPPSHVKFFFATTDPKKLPVTILSRCLKFNLIRLSVQEMEVHLTEILKKESVEFEEAAVRQLCIFAEGSVRDALSLLDQAIAYGNGRLQLSEVEAMLGVVDYGHTLDILRYVSADDATGLFRKIDDLYAIAVDFNAVLDDLITLLHAVATYQVLPESAPSVQFSVEDIAEIADKLTPEEVQLFYQITLQGKRDLPFLPDAKNAFAMTMIRMLAFKPVSLDMSQQTGKKPGAGTRNIRLPDTAGKQVSATKQQPVTPSESTESATKQQPVTPSESTESATPAGNPVQVSLSEFANLKKWIELIELLKIKGLTKEVCRHAILEISDENTATIVVDKEYDMLRTAQREQEIRDAFETLFNRPIKINFRAADPGSETPQQASAKKERQRIMQADEAIKNDAVIQSLQENLDAEIIPGSIKPLR